MEGNPAEAVKNNILGTWQVARASAGYGAETFILISTDKAVNPTSIMGATKRVDVYKRQLKQEYERINVEGTRRLVRAARRAGCSRMIFFSTINVYGSTPPGQIFDEDAPLRPADDYAASKACGEEIVLSGIDAVVLRLAAVYGPRMKGNYRRMAGALRRRLFFPVGRGENRRTLVFDCLLYTSRCV